MINDWLTTHQGYCKLRRVSFNTVTSWLSERAICRYVCRPSTSINCSRCTTLSLVFWLLSANDIVFHQHSTIFTGWRSATGLIRNRHYLRARSIAPANLYSSAHNWLTTPKHPIALIHLPVYTNTYVKTMLHYYSVFFFLENINSFVLW